MMAGCDQFFFHSVAIHLIELRQIISFYELFFTKIECRLENYPIFFVTNHCLTFEIFTFKLHRPVNLDSTIPIQLCN